MQSNRQSTFGDTPDGNPIAIPGTGALGIPTILRVPLRTCSADSLLREDERLIVTEFNNVTIDTGKNFCS